jgi:hypothetical protein
VVILLVAIGDYSIISFWWLFHNWLLVAILLLAFGGYSTIGS